MSSPTGTTARAQLAHLLEAEQRLIAQFVDLLGHEETLLIAGETDQVLALAQEKTALFQQLQRHHDARTMLVGSLGGRNDDASMRTLCAGQTESLKHWDAILELGRQAQARNELNGKLIAERMQHNQAALSVLLSAADHPQLYDAEGSARPTGRGRHLGSA